MFLAGSYQIWTYFRYFAGKFYLQRCRYIHDFGNSRSDKLRSKPFALWRTLSSQRDSMRYFAWRHGTGFMRRHGFCDPHAFSFLFTVYTPLSLYCILSDQACILQDPSYRSLNTSHVQSGIKVTRGDGDGQNPVASGNTTPIGFKWWQLCYTPVSSTCSAIFVRPVGWHL